MFLSYQCIVLSFSRNVESTAQRGYCWFFCSRNAPRHPPFASARAEEPSCGSCVAPAILTWITDSTKRPAFAVNGCHVLTDRMRDSGACLGLSKDDSARRLVLVVNIGLVTRRTGWHHGIRK